MNFNSLLQNKAEFVNDILRDQLTGREMPGELKEALEYTLRTPGKRVRSALVLWCCELIGGKANHNA